MHGISRNWRRTVPAPAARPGRFTRPCWSTSRRRVAPRNASTVRGCRCPWILARTWSAPAEFDAMWATCKRSPARPANYRTGRAPPGTRRSADCDRGRSGRVARRLDSCVTSVATLSSRFAANVQQHPVGSRCRGLTMPRSRTRLGALAIAVLVVSATSLTLITPARPRHPTSQQDHGPVRPRRPHVRARAARAGYSRDLFPHGSPSRTCDTARRFSNATATNVVVGATATRPPAAGTALRRRHVDRASMSTSTTSSRWPRRGAPAEQAGPQPSASLSLMDLSDPH